MGFSLADTDAEAELRVVEQHCNIRRWFSRHARLLQSKIPPLTRSLVQCRKT
uniref:Uncharacterized protein n=1 Tax=Hyaloperonospora arabidopsidis (strain Emoy2) TaxID=559515 RepID=M4BRR1_HYAAE